MTDKEREALELRAISVSTKAALTRPMDDEDREQTKNTATELLARLERAVLEDGADPAMIEAVEAARQRVWDDEPAARPEDQE